MCRCVVSYRGIKYLYGNGNIIQLVKWFWMSLMHWEERIYSRKGKGERLRRAMTSFTIWQWWEFSFFEKKADNSKSNELLSNI